MGWGDERGGYEVIPHAARRSWTQGPDGDREQNLGASPLWLWLCARAFSPRRRPCHGMWTDMDAVR